MSFSINCFYSFWFDRLVQFVMIVIFPLPNPVLSCNIFPAILCIEFPDRFHLIWNCVKGL